MEDYTIGGKEYTREELLAFGKRHYPKFYWIKRGIGIGLMFIFGLMAVLFLIASSVLNDIPGEHKDVAKEVAQYYMIVAIVLACFAVIGLIVFCFSFVPKPDEDYIKHAIDYYTKLDENNKRREARQASRAEKEDINDLIKYKKLLDSGVITQAEYDAKKKELL